MPQYTNYIMWTIMYSVPIKKQCHDNFKMTLVLIASFAVGLIRARIIIIDKYRYVHMELRALYNEYLFWLNM